MRELTPSSLSHRLAIVTSDPASTPKARKKASGDANIAEK